MRPPKFARCLLAFLVLAASACGGRFESGEFFYRLEAHYAVKETGEPLDFDIVVACNIRTTNYFYTGPSFFAERYPQVIAKATSDGHAVMIMTPHVCEQAKLDRGWAPADYVPFAIWFDDVNDLSFGWGYATQSAYERRSAKLAYRPADPDKGTYTAKITRVSRAEWEAWRKKAAEEWVQTGALPGPWGYSISPDEAWWEEHDRVSALNGGKDLAHWCDSMVRLPVDALAVSTIEAAALANPGAYATDKFVAYDLRFRGMVDAFVETHRRGEKVPIFGGYTSDEVLEPIDGTVLRPPSFGSIGIGPVSERPHGYREHYPVLTYLEPPYIPDVDTGYVRQILSGPEWTGIAACGFSSPKLDAAAGADDPRLSAKDLILTEEAYPIFLNDEILFEDAFPIKANTQGVPAFLERTGFFWSEWLHPGGF